MKKFLTVILAFLLFALCFSGCGTYQPPIITDDIYGETPEKPGTDTKPGDPGDTDEDKLVFTVTLYSEGRRFSPNVIFYAQWTSEDKTEIISAPFNALGVAQTEGLDGEYRVTLSGLPDDYTYDPNGHTVDNENRDVTIDLLPIIPTENGGSDYYRDCITIKQLGTYRHTFNARNEKAWYRYEPQAQGKYIIESWVDVNENEVNPIMEHYNGNSSYVNIDYPDGTYDDGGSSSTYSKNFRFELQLNKGMIGNVWIFQLHADCKGEYPIKVDFTIKLIGDYEGTDTVFVPVEAKGPFSNINPAGKWTYNYRDNNRVLDSNRFKLNWVDVNKNGVFDNEDEGDGYYHLYDEVKYADTDGWGPTLFAKLNKDIEVMNYGDPNDGGSGGHFANPNIRLRFDGLDYTEFMNTYFGYCNEEGAHPVTQELKDFLQRYASNQKIFSDGESMAEIYYYLTATEEDMWLFACGYYL